MSPGLYVDAAANAAVAVVFMLVGRRFLVAPVAESHRVAAHAFGFWWLAFGFQAIFTAWRNANVAVGNLNPRLFGSIFIVETTLATLALWGLLYHASFVASGRGHRVRASLIVAGLLTFYGIVLGSREAVLVLDETWRTNLLFQPPLTALQRWAMTASFYGVMLGCGITYAVIASRLGEGPARRRAATVAAALAAIAVVDALILGPEQPTPLAPVLPFLKIPGAALVWRAYFGRGMVDASPAQPDTIIDPKG